MDGGILAALDENPPNELDCSNESPISSLEDSRSEDNVSESSEEEDDSDDDDSDSEDSSQDGSSQEEEEDESDASVQLNSEDEEESEYDPSVFSEDPDELLMQKKKQLVQKKTATIIDQRMKEMKLHDDDDDETVTDVEDNDWKRTAPRDELPKEVHVENLVLNEDELLEEEEEDAEESVEEYDNDDDAAPLDDVEDAVPFDDDVDDDTVEETEAVPEPTSPMQELKESTQIFINEESYLSTSPVETMMHMTTEPSGDLPKEVQVESSVLATSKDEEIQEDEQKEESEVYSDVEDENGAPVDDAEDDDRTIEEAEVIVPESPQQQQQQQPTEATQVTNKENHPSPPVKLIIAEDIESTNSSETGTMHSRRSIRSDGNIRRGKWSLGSKIGAGAFGVVHVGMNQLTGTLMAVKTIQIENQAKEVRREIELLKTLKHPNIVRYLGAEMNRNQLHIFQEWVPGGSVTGMLAKFGPFAIPVIRSYISQTLEGLAFLHENNIIHRDIKGSNILVNDEGIVKLADFGASKRLKGAELASSHTLRGTPYFMAPEVFEERYGSKADIWSIGCVVVQMSTGSPPFQELGFSNPVALYKYVKNLKEVPGLGNHSEDQEAWESLSKLVECCFRLDPEQRPSARELKFDSFFVPSDTASEADAQSGNLFSPSTDLSWEMLQSPQTKASPFIRRRNMEQEASPMMSPPIPRARANESPSHVPSRLPFSPPPDTSNWPAWAKEEHAKSIQTPKIRPNSNEAKLTDTHGSLAYSESSRSAVSSSTTPLGLGLLDST